MFNDPLLASSFVDGSEKKNRVRRKMIDSIKMGNKKNDDEFLPVFSLDILSGVAVTSDEVT